MSHRYLADCLKMSGICGKRRDIFLHIIISSSRGIFHAQPWLNRMLRMCRHYWGKGDSEWKKEPEADICHATQRARTE
ncbi:hypothetical protein ACLB1T_18815 [Escherichia coli]